MFTMFMKICFLLLSFASLCCFGQPRLHPYEAIVFRQIAEKLGFQLLGSTEGEDPCQSAGKLPIYIEGEPAYGNITCQHTIGNYVHITNIALKRLNLQGSLPPELTNLKYLKEIDLARNYLSGTLPKEWASLQDLNKICLSANNLSGEIPAHWGYFTNLKSLSLEANQLSGAIPEELGNLVNLTKLELSSNQLSGRLPKTLARMKNMTKFKISDNRFDGPVPEFIGELTNLERLDMYSTGLEGPIPDTISSLENLKDLWIADMIGPKFAFPNLTNLTSKKFNKLILRNLNMSGTIPSDIFRVENILDLTFNHLEGEIKPTDDAPKQQYMFLSGNMLSGNIPSSFLSRDRPIDLSYNNFTALSSCGDASEYMSMYRSFSSNKSGSLSCPSTPQCQTYYRSLHINCGGPNEIVNNTKYEGDHHTEVAVKGDGAAFHYGSGTRWGVISAGQFLDKDDQVEGYTLTANNTSVRRYPKLYSTARASPLFLTYYSYCLANGNYTVNLHFAEILFMDEVPYHRAGRRLFDIYIQEILVMKDFNIKEKANGTGKEIKIPFNTSVTSNTLEIRLHWAGKGTTDIPDRGNYGPIISAISICYGSSITDCDDPKSKMPIIIGVVTAVLFLILCVVGFFCWKRYFGHKNTRERELRGLDLQTGIFTYRQLKAATNNFDSANKIGEGGFGSVYKGQLLDGTVIAVKKLSSRSRQGNREFVNEIGMISGLQHPNLVKLFGCCVAENQLLLVYEYMENNCLAHALFGSDSTLRLDWATRQKICVGIARGLAFLHEESTLRIVHRDIKATNVLLDKELNAKISDFGLAKLKEDDNTHISTRIAGTIGYMAPEYALWGYLTEKADVYSFGVVVLEIVSGRSNASHRAKSECVSLLELAFNLQQKEKLMEIVDPKLENEFNKEEVERMIKLALLCSNASPALRPAMSEVVSMLETQTIIPEVVSDPSIYGSDLQLKQLKGQYQQMQYQNSSGSKTSAFSSDKTGIGSSTTSAHDLYSINSESIRNLSTSHDLYPDNSDTMSLNPSKSS